MEMSRKKRRRRRLLLIVPLLVLTGLVLLIAVLIPNINKDLFASVRRKFRKI